MPETASAARLAEVASNGAGRRLRRRRSLPDGRAVVGGFLVAAAAVGIFAAYLRATTTSERDYIVARRELAVGHQITADDLARVSADLPPVLQRQVFTALDRLVGAVVLGPVARGELVQSSAVLAERGEERAGREISFPIESARAVDGQLRPGELIDVLATYGTGAEAYTVTVVRAVRIADRSQASGAISGGGDQVVTLTVPTEATSLAIAHAMSTGALTLVRSAADAEQRAVTAGPDETPYQTPRPSQPTSAPPGSDGG